MVAALHWSVIPIFISLAVAVSAEPDARLLRQAMETVILPATYPKCSLVDFENEYHTCEIHEPVDADHLISSGFTCSATERMSTSALLFVCPDGSINKTCLATSSDRNHFVCACHSAPRAFSEGGE